MSHEEKSRLAYRRGGEGKKKPTPSLSREIHVRKAGLEIPDVYKADLSFRVIQKIFAPFFFIMLPSV